MSKTNWPIVPGSYIVGDPNAPVAICTLTTERLMSPLANLPGVAIAGMVYTANLGITRIVMNVTANPAIRFLLICGRDSNLFRPGQSLGALVDHGTDDQKRIIGASGYDPVLNTLTPDQISLFRKQIELVDWTSEEDIETLKKKIDDLASRNPGVFKSDSSLTTPSSRLEEFVEIRPGGQREPLIYDPKGYFVISIEPDKGEIVLRHYLPDHTPSHEMRGRGASSMALGLLREGLVTQLSHAAYLGEELSKAQTALQFSLRYDQDRPLKPKSEPPSSTETTTTPSQSATPKPPPLPMTLEQFEAATPGQNVDLVLSITKIPEQHQLVGTFLKMDEAELFTAYHLTDRTVGASWTDTTKMIMGQANEIVEEARVRIGGSLQSNGSVSATHVIILTKVTKIIA